MCVYIYIYIYYKLNSPNYGATYDFWSWDFCFYGCIVCILTVSVFQISSDVYDCCYDYRSPPHNQYVQIDIGPIYTIYF